MNYDEDGRPETNVSGRDICAGWVMAGAFLLCLVLLSFA